MQQYLEVCKAVTTHGVAGEVKVELWCDDAAFLGRFKRLYRGPQGQAPIAVTKVRAHKNMALVTFEGVNDMDAARALRGQAFYFDRGDVHLAPGRWYVADLIGCEVRDADTGKVYGVVTNVSRPGPQDIYTVKAPDGREYMFPGVDALLKERNPPDGYITVTPIPALFADRPGSERTG